MIRSSFVVGLVSAKEIFVIVASLVVVLNSSGEVGDGVGCCRFGYRLCNNRVYWFVVIFGALLRLYCGSINRGCVFPGGCEFDYDVIGGTGGCGNHILNGAVGVDMVLGEEKALKSLAVAVVGVRKDGK